MTEMRGNELKALRDGSEGQTESERGSTFQTAASGLI